MNKENKLHDAHIRKFNLIQRVLNEESRREHEQIMYGFDTRYSDYLFPPTQNLGYEGF